MTRKEVLLKELEEIRQQESKLRDSSIGWTNARHSDEESFKEADIRFIKMVNDIIEQHEN